MTNDKNKIHAIKDMALSLGFTIVEIIDSKKKHNYNSPFSPNRDLVVLKKKMPQHLVEFVILDYEICSFRVNGKVVVQTLTARDEPAQENAISFFQFCLEKWIFLC